MPDPVVFNTPTDLANRVRQRYPGAYGDKSDTELATAWLKKYPVYWNNVNAAKFAEKGMWQPSATATPATAPAHQPTAMGRFMESPGLERANRTAIDLLPSIGGTVGAIATAPGVVTSMAGAAGGTAAGQGLADYLKVKEGYMAAPTAKQEAMRIGGSAALGAGSELGGQLAAKGVEKFVAPKLAGAAGKIVGRIIKPSTAQSKLVAGAGKAETVREVSNAVSAAAGNARTLSSLADHITGSIDRMTAETDRIVGSYHSPEVEIPASQVRPTVPQSRMLPGGRPMLPGAVGPAQAEGKVFVKQGGINLTRILQRSARKAANEVSVTELPDKTPQIARITRMIQRRAGRGDMSPQEALALRRQLYDISWPKALRPMRDDIYGELNRQIGSFLQPQDLATFKANNAAVHRLLRGRDAVDTQMAKHLINGAKIALHSGAMGAAGWELAGRKGALTGAVAGAVLGSTPTQLAIAQGLRAAAKVAPKTMPAVIPAAVKRLTQAGLLTGAEHMQHRGEDIATPPNPE